MILVGHLDGAVADSRLVTEVAEWLDQLTKQQGSGALTFLLFTDGHPFYGAPLSFDFQAGRPVELALTTLGSPDAVRWSAYLHHRLAWESAGNLECALMMDSVDSVPELAGLSLRIGDEPALENAFGLFADHRFAALEEGLRRAWTDFATRPAAPFPTVGPGLWRPSPGDELRPEPSLARALLRGGATGRARWRLRDSVACRPLATELLMRCLDLEALLRADHAQSLIPASTTGMPCAEKYRRFVNGNLPSVEYPPSHPAPPARQEDAWLFASLGEIVYHLDSGLSPSLARRYQELVALRNAVAHGHHVGWKQWQVLRLLSGLGP